MQESIDDQLRREGRRFCLTPIPDQTLYYAFLRDHFDLAWLDDSDWFEWLSGYSHYKALDCRSLFWEAEMATVPLTGHCAGYNYAKDKIIYSVPHVKAIQENGLWEHLLLSTVHELTHLADYHSTIREQALAETTKAEESNREAFHTDDLAGLLFNRDYHYDCSEVNAKGSQLAYIYFLNGGDLEAAIDYDYNGLKFEDENEYGEELMLETNTKIREWLFYVGERIKTSLLAG